MCRDESKSFKETTLVTLLSLINEIENILGQKVLIAHNKSDNVIKLFNGSQILYGGLDSRDGHDKVKSMELGCFAVDEASECGQSDIDMLESRLRWRLPNGKHPNFFGLYASNPEPCYIKERFVLPQAQGCKEENRIFIQALPSDNNWLPDDYIKHISQGKPDYWVKRYIQGSWDAAEGQIWPQFDYNIHVFPNQQNLFEIPRADGYSYPTIFACCDFGQTNPTAFLGCYVDRDGNIFVFDEYYSPGLVSAHSRNIRLRFDINQFSYMVADPSIWRVAGEKNGRAWSVADEFSDNGIYFVRAENAVDAGINRVGEYLAVDPKRVNPVTGKMGSPKLFISARCFNLIKEIPEYQWTTNRGKEDAREKPIKRADHAVDALRYGIMSRPSTEVTKPKPSVDSFNYLRDSMANSRMLNEIDTAMEM